MKKTISIIAACIAAAASADLMDRPTGFRVGKHLTLKPYVSMSYTYDSNADSSAKRDTRGYSSWCVQPGIDFTHKGNGWDLLGGVFYTYHAYNRNVHSMDSSSYGERLSYSWSNQDSGTGWALTLNETYTKISQDDDMTNDGGRGIGRDRTQATVGGVLERRVNERWHGNVNAGYYYLDYDNDSNKYAPLYGWTRWNVGAEAGYVASKWTDFLVTADYQGYTQDNDRDRDWVTPGAVARGGRYASDSKGWKIHAGIGSHATERISYRALIGWTHFDYAHAHECDGATYSLSGKWVMSDNWMMMALAQSYYHPSERNYGSAIRTDSASLGISHSMVRNKLTATFDVAYRHQQHEYSERSDADYDNDIITARLGMNWVLNRFVTTFARAEYQKQFSDGSAGRADWDYDRWRGTIGLRLTY